MISTGSIAGGVLYAKRNGGQATRIGFSVSKKYGKAVQRNRIKRQLRHAAAEQKDTFSPGYDYVFVVRRAAAGQSYPQLMGQMARLLKELSSPRGNQGKARA